MVGIDCGRIIGSRLAEGRVHGLLGVGDVVVTTRSIGSPSVCRTRIHGVISSHMVKTRGRRSAVDHARVMHSSFSNWW
jgi:hypothetical protein